MSVKFFQKFDPPSIMLLKKSRKALTCKVTKNWKIQKLQTSTHIMPKIYRRYWISKWFCLTGFRYKGYVHKLRLYITNLLMNINAMISMMAANVVTNKTCLWICHGTKFRCLCTLSMLSPSFPSKVCPRRWLTKLSWVSARMQNHVWRSFMFLGIKAFFLTAKQSLPLLCGIKNWKVIVTQQSKVSLNLERCNKL